MADQMKKLDNLSFSEALNYLLKGSVVIRKGWNGKDIYVCRRIPDEVEGDFISNVKSLPTSMKYLILKTTKKIRFESQFMIFNSKTGRADNWVPSVSDITANDWEVVEYNIEPGLDDKKVY